MGRITVCAALFATSTVLLSGAPASAGTLQPSGWQYAKVAATDTVSGGDALSCVTQNWCMSVGSGGTQIWDGQQWSASTTGQPKFDIRALSCFSKWDCMAVGTVIAGTGVGEVQSPVAVHWNGTNWTQLDPSVQLPDEPLFTGVSCPATKTCFVTGYLNSRVLLWQNGIWTSQPISLPADATKIDVGDIDCPAVTSCHATAGVHFAGQPSYAVSTGVAHWDGSAWSVELLPDDQYGRVGIGSISCPTTNSCVGVGANQNSDLVGESWDGTTWHESVIPDSPNKGDQAEQEPDGYQELTSVSCWAVDRCQAVGITNTAPFHRYWNGTTWSSLANPTATDVLAVAGVGIRENDIDCVYYTFCLTTGDRMERFLP